MRDSIKALPRAGGIYKIEHLPTGRSYIGRAKNMRSRVFAHFWSLEKRKHRNYLLQKDYREFGSKTFRVSVIECCDHSRDERERFYIDSHKPEYNLCSPGKEPDLSRLRVKRDEELCNRRHQLRGRKASERLRIKKELEQLQKEWIQKRLTRQLVPKKHQAGLSALQEKRLLKRAAWHVQRQKKSDALLRAALARAQKQASKRAR